jgi:hypothetical protein
MKTAPVKIGSFSSYLNRVVENEEDLKEHKRIYERTRKAKWR